MAGAGLSRGAAQCEVEWGAGCWRWSEASSQHDNHTLTHWHDWLLGCAALTATSRVVYVDVPRVATNANAGPWSCTQAILSDALLITINGIANGMRNSG